MTDADSRPKLTEEEIDSLEPACQGSGEYGCIYRTKHRKTGKAVGGQMVDAVETILADRAIQVTKVVELRAGDRVIFVTPEHISQQHAQQIRDHLEQRVPDLEFAIAAGFEALVIQRTTELNEAYERGRREVAYAVQQHICTCHTADHPHEDWCPAFGLPEDLRELEQR